MYATAGHILGGAPKKKGTPTTIKNSSTAAAKSSKNKSCYSYRSRNSLIFLIVALFPSATSTDLTLFGSQPLAQMTPFLANDRVEAFYLDINSDEFKVTVQYHQDFCWMIWVWRKLSGMSWGKSSTSSHFLKIKLASCCQNSPKPKKPSKWWF